MTDENGPRAQLEAKAAELRAAGYTVLDPDDLTYRQAVDHLHDQQIAIRRQIDEAMVKLGLAMRRFPVLVDPGHEMVNSFYRVADMVRDFRTDLRPLRRIHPRATPMRMCQGCSRAAGELTENGCPACGPDAVITDARGNRLPTTQEARMHVAIERFGEDHWSMLLAAESAGRGYGGRIDPNTTRCNSARHPQEFAARTTRRDGYRSTVLKDGSEAPGHDSYDCLDDLQAAGLITWDGAAHRATTTRSGMSVVAHLMAHRLDGGTLDTFQPDKGSAA